MFVLFIMWKELRGSLIFMLCGMYMKVLLVYRVVVSVENLFLLGLGDLFGVVLGVVMVVLLGILVGIIE